MYSGDGYDCSGKWLYGFRSGMMPFPPKEKEKFFKNKMDLGVIFKFSFKIRYEKSYIIRSNNMWNG